MRSANAYVLESAAEFERLERQARTPAYDCRDELSDLVREARGRGAEGGPRHILDAGCGSGVVARWLAGEFSAATVYGCDFSELRIRQTRQASRDIPNLRIDHAGLEALPYPSDHFDLIVCRFVLQHMNPAVRDRALGELHRCLRPGGTLRIIETDGLFFNLWPLSRKLEKGLERWRKDPSVDMFASRKLPGLLHKTGFSSVDWDIQAVSFRGAELEAETEIYASRFAQTLPLFARVLGSKRAALAFGQDFVRTLKKPGAVIFHNKFLITARKT